MSYTKQAFEAVIEKNQLIQKQTIDDNDLTALLVSLNSIMNVADKFSTKDGDLKFYWNEVISEMIAVIHASISGYNRLALSGLRNILELTCHAFYYFDHKIELKIAQNTNSKADKYVSALIRDDLFFTSKYILSFDSETYQEIKENKFSDFLKAEYAHLSDVVHGRNSTLLKVYGLNISYDKSAFKAFEARYMNVASIISAMYLLRFDDMVSIDVEKLASRINVVRKVK